MEGRKDPLKRVVKVPSFFKNKIGYNFKMV